jgi:hypothetical protein
MIEQTGLVRPGRRREGRKPGPGGRSDPGGGGGAGRAEEGRETDGETEEEMRWREEKGERKEGWGMTGRNETRGI